jgi:hypothetical protein
MRRSCQRPRTQAPKRALSRYAQNLGYSYGADFQITKLQGDRCVKIGALLMAYWTAEELTDGGVSVLPVPYRHIRTAYMDDILIVRSMGGIGLGEVDDRVFQVPPVHRKLTAHERQSPANPDIS